MKKQTEQAKKTKNSIHGLSITLTSTAIETYNNRKIASTKLIDLFAYCFLAQLFYTKKDFFYPPIQCEYNI